MKSRTTAGLLALFFGGVGVHKFYLGRWIQGLFYLVFCWTFIPALIGFIEAIRYFVMDEDKFHAAYGDAISNAERVSPKTHVRCPDCRELVRMDANKCKHCGCALVPQLIR